MLNVRVFIKELLDQLGYRVRQARPEGDIILPLIVYAETDNVNVGLWHDRLTYQFDVYTNTFSELLDVLDEVDDKIRGLGFQRTYVSPDTTAREDTDLYHKYAVYTADVNTRTNNIYQNEIRRN